MGRLLGLDFGTRRVGAAVSDPRRLIATPLEVLYDWNDVGDWRALTTLVPPDDSGNTLQGDVLARETSGSIIVSDDGGLIATLGVEDLVIVQSGGATLVARKDRLDALKSVVERLETSGFGAYL